MLVKLTQFCSRHFSLHGTRHILIIHKTVFQKWLLFINNFPVNIFVWPLDGVINRKFIVMMSLSSIKIKLLESSLSFARFSIGIITHVWVLLTQTQTKQEEKQEAIVLVEPICGKRLWKLEGEHTTAIYGNNTIFEFKSITTPSLRIPRKRKSDSSTYFYVGYNLISISV